VTGVQTCALPIYGSNDVENGSNDGSSGSSGRNGSNGGSNDIGNGSNDGSNNSNDVGNGSNDGSNGSNDGSNGSNGSNDGSNETRISNLIRENTKITVTELAAKSGLSYRTCERVIAKLKKDGKLLRIGSTRGYWEIID
jgi:hypothetical protein